MVPHSVGTNTQHSTSTELTLLPRLGRRAVLPVIDFFTIHQSNTVIMLGTETENVIIAVDGSSEAENAIKCKYTEGYFIMILPSQFPGVIAMFKDFSQW